jgi:hypothetical protein
MSHVGLSARHAGEHRIGQEFDRKNREAIMQAVV